MEGKWAPQIGKENKYGYNGKELDEDFGLNWHHYGFRMYDAAIGRFTGVDPISDRFTHLSTYNYADNSPIANIDLHGLQSLFAADGSLIGYNVQEGQGPHQIAQDINENYGCEMSCEVTYTDIVQDNPEAFPNGFEENGDVKGIADDAFKSGNIVPDQDLVIDGGIDQTKAAKVAETESAIGVLDKKIDSMDNVVTKGELEVADSDRLVKDSGTPSATNDRLGDGTAGGTIGQQVLNDAIYKPDLKRQKSRRDRLLKTRDSLHKTIENE